MLKQSFDRENESEWLEYPTPTKKPTDKYYCKRAALDTTVIAVRQIANNIQDDLAVKWDWFETNKNAWSDQNKS